MASERQTIINALKTYHDTQFTPGVYEHSIFGKAAMLLEADVIHGKWLNKDGKMTCSCCGWSRSTLSGYEMYVCDGERWVSMERSDYCPHCGVQMDGDNNE